MIETLPHDLEIERAVLCCVLLKPELMRSCDFPARAFFSEFHRAVYSILNDLDADGSEADATLLARRFREIGPDRTAQIGQITEAQAISSRFESYRRELLRIAYQRSIVEIEERVSLMALAGEGPDAIESGRDKLLRRAQDDFRSDDGSLDEDYPERELRKWYQRLDVDAVSTGYVDLDTIVGDLYPGMVLTVLARPGIGKSMLGLNLIHSWLRSKATWACMFASLEMGVTLATNRLVRICENWGKHDISKAMLTGGIPSEYRRLIHDRYCLYSRSRQPVDALAHAIGTWERTHERKIRCLVIDYFQYLRGEKGESPYERGSRLSRELKELAKDRSLVIVNLCQVKRGIEGGKGTECPSLESARDSGTIEENADVVVGMWQPSPVLTDVSFKGLKVREGKSGLTATLAHDVETGRMSEQAFGLQENE